jgi:Mrp family chromosome partitioning ATPase
VYDLVVIDTPPLTAVSDAFPLLTKVDGVVIVGRIGHSRRDVAEQLHQVLASSGAPLLGVIANGSKSSGPVPYPGGGGSSGGVASVDGASSSSPAAALGRR